MQFGYTIIDVADVADVPASLEFFGKAFGLTTRCVHETDYGERETGQTALAFAAHHLGHNNLPGGYVAAESSPVPLGMEIALVTESVTQAHAQAVSVGATSITEPSVKPWGQTVSYVRCPDGTLVELCSPMGD